MSALLNSGWVQLGAVGIVGLVVWLIITGRLQPRSTTRDLVGRADRSAELWQKAYEREVERADLATKQSDQLLTGMATVERLIRTLVPRDPS